MKYGSCKECGQRAVIQDDGVSHHISEETGGADHDQDAKHAAVVQVRRVVTVHRLSLQFDADPDSLDSAEDQAEQVIDEINKDLACSNVGQRTSAQLFATPDEIEVEVADEDD